MLFGKWFWGCAQQLQAKRQKSGAPTVGQKTEMSDAHEALRQDVQQEALQELIDRQGSELLLIVVSRIAPAESDLAIDEGDQAMVGDGHAMGIAAEILQHIFGTAERRF